MKPYEVDTLNAHPEEERDSIRILIDDLLARYGDTLVTYIKMKREARSADRSTGVLWPVYQCPTLVKK